MDCCFEGRERATVETFAHRSETTNAMVPASDDCLWRQFDPNQKEGL